MHSHIWMGLQGHFSLFPWQKMLTSNVFSILFFGWVQPHMVQFILPIKKRGVSMAVLPDWMPYDGSYLFLSIAFSLMQHWNHQAWNIAESSPMCPHLQYIKKEGKWFPGVSHAKYVYLVIMSFLLLEMSGVYLSQ